MLSGLLCVNGMNRKCKFPVVVMISHERQCSGIHLFIYVALSCHSVIRLPLCYVAVILGSSGGSFSEDQ